MTIYLTKEVNVDTEVEVEVELELDEVIDGNEDEIIERLLEGGYRDEVIDAVKDEIINSDKFIEEVKSRHDLISREEAEAFHVEPPKPERSGFHMTDDLAFRASEPGMIADLFKLHDGQVAVRIRKTYGGGYFVADPDTVRRLLELLPPPTEEYP